MCPLANTITETQKEFLKQNYGKHPVESIAVSLGISTNQVIKKAGCLGLSKSNNWSREEDSLLHELAETMPIADLIRTYRRRAIARGLRLHRTDNAIKNRITRLGYSRHPQIDFYSCGQIAGALGIERTTVGNWIRQGKLKAQRRDGDNGWYAIQVKHLCKFFINYRNNLVQLPIDQEGWCWILSQFELI